MAVAHIMLRSLIRREAITIGALGAFLAFLGFLAGRQTVHEGWIEKKPAALQSERMCQPELDKKSDTPDYRKVTIQNIATVPFSQLYDVLRAVSREQLLAWARDLEQMPRGPHQRAAVAAYYKSLIQVDHRVAIEAVLHAQNLAARDVASDAMTKAAPESIWGDLAEMVEQMPFPGRLFDGADLIENWSRMDPVAVSQFIERHPLTAGKGYPEPGDDSRISSLLSNWGAIDPAAARKWLEADASRQRPDALQSFLTGWGRVDRAGAIDYAVANAGEPKLGGALNELVYQFVRFAKDDASRLIALLPPERAKAALKNVAEITSPKVDNYPERLPDYQRPPEEVARWMITLPMEFWQETIGPVAAKWMDEDSASATAWLNQIRPDLRDAAIVSCCRAAMSDYHSREGAIEVGLTISDQRQRDAVLGALVRSIETSTPGAMSASERINDLSISAEQKAYLRAFITGSPNDH